MCAEWRGILERSTCHDVIAQTPSLRSLVNKVQAVCGPDLIHSKYRKLRPSKAHRTWGCCYVATEAVYHLWGKKEGFLPHCLKYEIADGVTTTHWWLRKGDEIVDPTKEQFDYPVKYDTGKRANFQSQLPSKRCREIIQGVQKKVKLTPVEKHGGYWVKRDDTFEVAGIRGGKGRICWELSEGQKGLVVSGSRQSLLINITAHVAKEREIPCRAHTPTGELTAELKQAKKYGAKIVQHNMGYPNVLASHAKKDAEDLGWREIPFGLECKELVEDVSQQVENIPKEIKRIVVPVGSGMTLAGVLEGLRRTKREIPVLGVRVGGGSDPNKFSPVLRRRMEKFGPQSWESMVEFVHSGVPYSTEAKKSMLGDLKLDPIYEAKCLPFLQAGDLLWVVGIRRTAEGK